MGKQNGQQAVLDIPVEFGGVSIGDATARLGIRIDRGVCNINTADEVFCGHRLNVLVKLGGSGDQAGQKALVDDLDEVVSSVFDCKRIGVNAKQITTGLTFSLADVDIKSLAKFSKGAGRLIVQDVSEIPEDAPDESDEDMAELPGSLKAEGPWKDVPLSDLFDGAILKALNKAGLQTVGGLAEFTASDKQLIDLDGIGKGKAEKIENRMLQFWADNPDAEQPQPETAEA